LIPFISIHSQKGLIGINSEPGHYEIRSTRPVTQVSSTPSYFTANNRSGELRIDHTLTDNALTGGKPEAFWQRIYSQYKDIAKQNLEKIVMEGNQQGDLRYKGNPMAEQALNDFIEGPPDLQVFGFASPANISFQYIPNELDLQFVRGTRDVEVQTFKPEINYQRGSVNIYMQQYPQVTITPPALDIKI